MVDPGGQDWADVVGRTLYPVRTNAPPCVQQLSIWRLQDGTTLTQVQACAIVTVFRAVLFLGLTMSFILQPWQLLFVILAGWVNEQQQQVIEYLRTENQVLKEKLGKKSILLSNDQRRRLAVKGKVLGRKRLEQIGTLFTPDTILRWHRFLVAGKWDYSSQRTEVGRPRVRQEIVELVVRFAQENPTWGYDRIQGALANVGYHLSDQTIGNILQEQGIEPAPDRKRQTTWKTFIQSHWDVLAAVDFTTIEVWTKRGLVTFYLLFVMDGGGLAARSLRRLHSQPP